MTQGVSVETVLEGRFALDGGAMFGVVPKPLWSKTNPADEANRIELATRCMLIRHPTAGNILVDVGIGDKWDAKGRRIYKISHQAAAPVRALGLEEGLGDHGLALEDIDHVILTHLHFDHAGGVSRLDPEGGIVPTFPGRPHYVLADHWSWANAPSERDRASFRREDFGFFEGTPDAAGLVLVDGLSEVFPGVTLIPCHGHTPGMACVKVDAEDGTWIYLADLIPTIGHLRVPFVMGYDLEPVVTCREKREILTEAAMHGWRLFFEHDPEVPSCLIEDDNRGGWRRAI